MNYDDVVIGGGHNGLTAAAYLARAGRRVLVLESADHVGGAAVSAQAFPGVDARLSRYSYLVSLMPAQVIADLDLDVRLIRRRFSSFTPVPTDPGRGLLVDHGDEAATAAAFTALTGSGAEHAAWQDFYGRVHRLAQRVFPTVLEPLRSERDLAALVDDAELWDALVGRPLGEVLQKQFADDTVRGIVATDALIGTFADLDGADLRQNVCFLYHLIGGGTGDWDVPVGGMGAVTAALAKAAAAAGAEIRTGVTVTAVDPDGTVTWQDSGKTGRRTPGTATAGTIHAACAPTVLNRLLTAAGAEPVETEASPEGAQLKVNMLLSRLPRLRDEQVDPRAAFAGTFHVNEGYAQLQQAYAEAAAGRVPHLPPCEIYCHSLSDRSILGSELAATDAQTLTLFGLHLPARLFAGTDHDDVKDLALARTLESLNAVLAEPIQDVLLGDGDGAYCLEARTPVELEADLGLPGGNIFHRSLQWPWAERADEVGTWGVETRHENVLIAGAGARRGGGVSGIPGHNAAQAALAR
ncbi:NAD(P)/FAD-dependent oxidoreductase [Nostocoides sp. HKS02]|uniref:phytoene desaturase family protein n=1 Tax=Nostocoides sp. HKS02 TaxID=1813880 RepID=UPI0012B47749|nr:NAD(P)/FAD-dependent oxidoreductase [Tetrasphaera sp. HKS02]QGN57043.1 NAD(P)-binding protein [Tetrasphaera sp. HKS02]